MNSDILVKLLEREYLQGLRDGLLCAAANMEDCEWTIEDLRYAADVALELIGERTIDWKLCGKLCGIVERRTEQHKDEQAENGKDESRG